MNYSPEAHSGWTDERFARALQLQKDGLSARQIADDLGGVSRNGVIGKLQRTGNAGKYTRSRSQYPPIFYKPRAPKPPECCGEEINFIRRIKAKPPQHSSQKRAQRQLYAEQLREEFACTEIIDLTPEQSATKCTLVGLNRHTCRWPLGNPQQPDFGYCGAEPYPRRDGRNYPYCAAHCRIAYQVRARA